MLHQNSVFSPGVLGGERKQCSVFISHNDGRVPRPRHHEVWPVFNEPFRTIWTELYAVIAENPFTAVSGDAKLRIGHNERCVFDARFGHNAGRVCLSSGCYDFRANPEHDQQQLEADRIRHLSVPTIIIVNE
jgi:hypothetical protein